MLTSADDPMMFERPVSVPDLRRGLIGSKLQIDGPFGHKPLIYADYTATGRALDQVEDWLRVHALPYFANPHTEVSACGQKMNGLRRTARDLISRSVEAGDTSHVIFCGSGATAAANRLPHLLGLIQPSGDPRGVTPLVIVGPYEHHSNILPWREAGAQTIAIDEAPGGGVDLAALERVLLEHGGKRPVIGSFSAASNVTGILTDVVTVTRLLKAHGALAVWDYACGAPYLRMSMQPAPEAPVDALFFSPHKFPGGPGASGVLVLRRSAVRMARPTWPGGGSVSYVSDWAHDYFDDLELKEEAGSPNTLGDIRAALALYIRDTIGTGEIERRGQRFLAKAWARWSNNDRIVLLGHPTAKRLPIVSFLLKDARGQIVHHRLVTKMLSDLYGVQAREGCSCAGPYGHRLLNVDRALSERIRQQIREGHILAKPGWTRLNFCHLLDEHTADYIVEAVHQLPAAYDRFGPEYQADPKTGNFVHGQAATHSPQNTNASHWLEGIEVAS